MLELPNLEFYGGMLPKIVKKIMENKENEYISNKSQGYSWV